MTLSASILALALATPAAHGARLFRCEARLLRSVGEVTVPGWALSESDARARARDVAWWLAAADRWPREAAGAVARPGALQRARTQLAEALDVAGHWRDPGAEVVDGSCSSELLPPDRGQAWSVTWGEADRAVVRHDAGIAVEAARRRACVGPWQHRLVLAAQRGRAAEAERFAAVWETARAATDGLFACMTRVAPDRQLVAADAVVSEVTGTVQCMRPRRVDGRWTGAPAWGVDLETAREAALQQDLLVALRRAVAALGAVSDDRDPVTRAARLEALSIAHLAGLVVVSDGSEQALMSCVAAPPRPARVAWTHGEGAACAGWPTGSGGTLQAAAAALESERTSRCEAAFRTAVVVDWVGAHRCEARCRSELAVDGWAAAPVWGAGEPRRGTSEDAQRALMDAFTARDFDQLGVITGGLMFEPGFEATYTADPGAFWKSIEVAIETGQWAERSEWSEVGGVWVLGFR